MTQNSQIQGATRSSPREKALQAADQRSPSEEYMAKLWSEIIGLDDVKSSSKFLEVGGNSLTLNIILKRVQQETGAALPPQQFFQPEQSSLFEIAQTLDVLLEQGRRRSD